MGDLEEGVRSKKDHHRLHLHSYIIGRTTYRNPLPSDKEYSLSFSLLLLLPLIRLNNFIKFLVTALAMTL